MGNEGRWHLRDPIFDRTLCGKVVMPLSQLKFAGHYDGATCFVCRSILRKENSMTRVTDARFSAQPTKREGE